MENYKSLPLKKRPVKIFEAPARFQQPQNLCMEPFDLSVETAVHNLPSKLSHSSITDSMTVSNTLNDRQITHSVANKLAVSISSIPNENSENNYKNNLFWKRSMYAKYSSKQEKSVPGICSSDLTPSYDSRLSSSESEYIEEPEAHEIYIHDIQSCEQPLELPRYKCNDCGKLCSTPWGLAKHQKFYCPCKIIGKQHKCNSCDKVFKSVSDLTLHIRTHTLPYSCKICEKSFSRKWYLKRHNIVHTREKLFRCQYCHRAFSHQYNLRCHMETHSTVKQFQCSICDLSFTRKYSLKRHNEKTCPLKGN